MGEFFSRAKRKILSQLRIFNKLQLERGSVLWLVRGVLRRGFLLLRKIVRIFYRVPYHPGGITEVTILPHPQDQVNDAQQEFNQENAHFNLAQQQLDEARRRLEMAAKELDNVNTQFDEFMYQLTNTAARESQRIFQNKPSAEKAQIIEILQTPTLPDRGSIISIITASRKIDNPNHRLTTLCETIIDKTHNLTQIELVLRVDDDDDLLYYRDIQKQYASKIRFRVIVGPRKGYQGLHEVNSEMLDYLAPASQLVFSVADDCTILRNDWDESFREIITKYPDNILFINTWRDYRIPYEDPHLFFWLMWYAGPPSLFWVVGRRVLQITAEIARKYEGWTACGENWMCDPFMEALQFHLWHVTKEYRTAVVTDTITARPDTIIPTHKEGGLFSHSPVAVNSYKKFLKEDVQAIIREMAEAVAKEMHHFNPESQSFSFKAPNPFDTGKTFMDQNTKSSADALSYVQRKLTEVLERTETKRFFEAHPLGAMWEENLKYLNPAIFDSTSALECLGYAFRHPCYSHSAQIHPISTRKFVEWTLRWLEKNGMPMKDWDASFEESQAFPENALVKIKNKRLSSDYLRWLSYLSQIRQYVDMPKESLEYLELGSGYGGMARAFKLAYPNARITLIDIPQSMCFSYLFLQNSFPNADIRIASSPEDVKNSTAEILLVPSPLAQYLEGKKIDLFLNSQSLGEMENRTVEYWADLIENRLQVKNAFLHNRLINDCPAAGSTRDNENIGSVFLDNRWQIKQWEYDPSFGRCMFNYGLAPRNCMIIATRDTKNNPTKEQNIQRSWELIEDIIYQDWAFMHYDRGWPQPQVCGSNVIEGGMEGNLFRLWESIRLYPNRYNVTIMLRYLELMRSGLNNIFFEEELYYRDLLNSDLMQSNTACIYDRKPYDDFMELYTPPFNFRTVAKPAMTLIIPERTQENATGSLKRAMRKMKRMVKKVAV